MDSVRFISNKLIKGMSDGDIHLGAANSIVLDGNLWLKRYRKTGSNFGLLTVDTCGRLNLTSDVEANKLTVHDDVLFSKYKKTSGNTGILTVDTAGKLGISTSINLDDYLKIGGNDLGYSDMIFGTTNVGGVHLKVNNSIVTTWGAGGMTNGGSIAIADISATDAAALSFNDAWGHYKSHLSSEGLFFNGKVYNADGIFCNSGNGFKIDDAGWNFATLQKMYYGDGRNRTYNFSSLSPTMIYNANDSGIYRGLYVNPYLGGTHAFLKERFRSIEVVKGNVLFNSEEGATGIGVYDTIHRSAILELKSTGKGFLQPRMSTSNRNSIPSAATGLMVYNTDSNWVEIKKPDGWYRLSDAGIATGGTSRASSQETAKPATFISRIGDGKTTVFTIKHNLNSEFVMVQFIDCGAEANCNLLLSIPEGARLEINGKDEVQLTFKNAPSFNRYKVMFLKIQ
jgi:hypothetical protein